MYQISIAEILTTVWHYARANPRPGVVAFSVLFLAAVVVDLVAPGIATILGLVAFVAQFGVISALLRKSGAHEAEGRPGRVGAFFFVGLASCLAIGLGLLLFVLPGIYLYARWLVAQPLVIGEGRRVGDALRTSWVRTAPASLSLTGALMLLLLPIGCWIASMWLLAAFAPQLQDESAALAVILGTEFLYAFGLVLASYASVAIYLRLRPAPTI